MKFEPGTAKIGGQDITPLLNEYLELQDSTCAKADDLMERAEDVLDEAAQAEIRAYDQMAIAHALTEGIERNLAMAEAYKLLSTAGRLRLDASDMCRQARDFREENREKLLEAKMAFFEKVQAVIQAYMESSLVGVTSSGTTGTPMSS